MANEILKLVPLAMSMNLAQSNFKKKKKKFNVVGQGMNNIVGSAMINEVAKFTG